MWVILGSFNDLYLSRMLHCCNDARKISGDLENSLNQTVVYKTECHIDYVLKPVVHIHSAYSYSGKG